LYSGSSMPSAHSEITGGRCPSADVIVCDSGGTGATTMWQCAGTGARRCAYFADSEEERYTNCTLDLLCYEAAAARLTESEPRMLGFVFEPVESGLFTYVESLVIPLFYEERRTF